MQTKKTSLFRKILKPLLIVGSIAGVLFAGAALAGVTQGIALSSIASNVDTSVKEISTVISDISLIAGVGFVMASFFKFHQHKLNPTQVPISQGVTLLLIGAGLIIFPSVLPTAKRAIFGSGAEIAKVGGGQIHSIIGS
ncbi:type IV secretion protein IcmD [Candidiatus Paracoxiella cheracis]|uniref:type IV secretion protein IcmD n=1 Tax=Candidiatus Paracoxiella cheracis TaxID=3405120 RepID=UPI003BF4BEC7